MKRFASHYLYINAETVYKKYVVEVESKRVIAIYPLVEEIENTIWMNGSIILSLGDTHIIKEELLVQLITRVTKGISSDAHIKNLNLFAHHIPICDLYKNVDLQFPFTLLTD